MFYMSFMAFLSFDGYGGIFRNSLIFGRRLLVFELSLFLLFELLVVPAHIINPLLYSLRGE